MTEPHDIYITKNGFPGHVSAFLLMCGGDRNNTVRKPLWYACIDIKMVQFDNARFLSAFCIYETALQRHSLLVIHFAEEARVIEPAQCIRAVFPILVELLRLKI
jgi:hypothetical protein